LRNSIRSVFNFLFREAV